MVAGHHGHHVDLPGLRRRFSVSLKGATLKSLIGVARDLGLQPRALRMQLAHLAGLKLPAVLHWDMNHFVVMTGWRRGKVVILDPAVGERSLPLEEVSKHFTGVALELRPGATFERKEERRPTSLRSLMGDVTGLRRGLAQLLLFGLVMQVCALAAPFFLQWVVDEAIVAADRDMLTVLGLGFLLLVCVQTAVAAVRSWATTVLATNLNFQWLGNVFAHLLQLPLDYFEKRHLGDIVSRFGSIQTIQRSLTTQFVEGIIDGVLVLSTLAMMFLYSGLLASVACGAVAIYAALRWSIFSGLREATAEQIIHAAKQQSFFIESARGVQSLRLYNRTDERRAGWMNALADEFNADLRIARWSTTYQTANLFLLNAERVVVIWLGALAVLDTALSVGMLFAFLSYKEQFSQRTAALIDKLFELRMLRLHAERVADIVMTEAESLGDSPETPETPDEIEIELRGLSFRYADGEPFILKDLDLRIPAGQCLAITGSSGCGKTTLVKLLLGLLTPTDGEILVNGVRLDHFGVARLRRGVGTVMQEDHLFAGSIADNIVFFDPEADLNRVAQCARLAAIHDEINGMPMRYNTLVGDIGTGLSGGQKQRILLARALYRQPRLLVLDEATSHLDVGNEQQVNAAIRQIALTRVLVAHRPETISMAERVIVLDKGRIVRDFTQAPAAPTGAEPTVLQRDAMA
jgi:ATP-binding cassette subfamily B protein RaxB